MSEGADQSEDTNSLRPAENSACAPCGTRATRLTAQNYVNGFLVDDELMGGVGAAEGGSGFFAYVLRHSTGEYLGYTEFPALEPALEAVNRVQRDWVFERMGGCDGTKCGEGNCKGPSCRAFRGQDERKTNENHL